MTSSEAVIRSILGAVRRDIRPLALAVDKAGTLLFAQHIPMDDILITKDIYPDVAKRLGKGQRSIARQIERLANACWVALIERELILQYIGAPLKDIRAPSDLIIYLAFYVYLEVPFFTAITQRPALLF